MMIRARRGSALILVLMMTLAIAGLSIAAIFMSSSAGLLSAFYDRERVYRLAAETGLEIARSRLVRDTALVVPDTGMRQLVAGAQVLDADGIALPSVRVNVYAGITGDTSGVDLPFITLIAASYDASGTRHVRRLDLRRESFARYALFADAFPVGQSHGPGVVVGRVHTNETWRGSASGNRYRDTVSAVSGVVGTGTFDVDSTVGGPRVRFPRDSTFPRLDTLAAAANLAFTPVSGGGRGSRIAFVAFDADNDSTIEAHEGFARIFDLATAGGVDTTRLRANAVSTVGFNFPAFAWLTYYRWDSPIVQNQCGAFYLRGGRWHFFPIATHRANWARLVIMANGANDFPAVTATVMGELDDYDYEAAHRVLQNTGTARCFPAGSPFLLTTERMTNSAGVVTGTAADTVPFGIITPPGNWPPSAPLGYGGSDTTFTVRNRTCTFSTGDTSGRCNNGTISDLGSWRAFGGTAVSGIPATVRQAAELPFLWPFSTAYNSSSRGVISARSGPLYVSGDVRGRVTLRVAGRATLIDRVRYVVDPNDPAQEACTDQFGLVASGDVLVVEGLMSRVRRFGLTNSGFSWIVDSVHTIVPGGESRFTIHGSFLSTSGTVGVENPGTTMGLVTSQLPCPDDAAASTATNGGCLAVTGGLSMRTYSGIYSSTTANSGYRYRGAVDRCQGSARRPPFFPLTNRYTFVRTLEIEPSQANTPAKIRALLMRLKGKRL